MPTIPFPSMHNQLETARVEVLKPFPREEELQAKLARLEELNALLNMDKREPEIVAEAEAPDNSQQPLKRKTTAPFFDLWCAKESYLKFTGEGLSGLEAVCTVSPEGGFPSVPGVNLQLLPLFAGYSACLCTASPAEIREQFL